MLTQPIAAFALGAAVLKHGLSKMSAAKMKKTCMRLGMWVGKKPTVAHLRQLLQPVHLAASMSREAGVRSVRWRVPSRVLSRENDDQPKQDPPTTITLHVRVL